MKQRIWSRPCQRRGQDAKVAKEVADALNRLLEKQGLDHLTGLPPEPVAHALLGALRRHAGNEIVQFCGCHALWQLCKKFQAVHGALQRDPSVYATVRAAGKVNSYLERSDFYRKELCVWLQPPCLVWRGRYR